MNENQLQAECVKWFYQSKYRFDHQKMLFKVNNNAPTLKAQMDERSTGLIAGVTDLIFIAFDRVIFIEMKINGGVLSNEQKIFKEQVQNRGHFYFVVRSLEQFISVIENTINNYGR